MIKSDSIAKLALALSRLQGEATDAPKDQAAFNYKYANLSGILEIARPLCLKHELSVTQLCTSEEGSIGVITVLMHSSGEYIQSTMMMPINAVKGSNMAQQAGSIITYARRYALAAILGLTQGDNDAANEIILPKTVAKETIQQKVRRIIIDTKIPTDIVKECLSLYGVSKVSELSDEQANDFLNKYVKEKV